MSGSLDLASVAEYYELLLQKESEPGRRVGWQNRASQEQKLGEVAELFAHETAPFTLYDIGCGLGALARFLERQALPVQYAGCDISSQMIVRARASHPGREFEIRDILKDPPVRIYDYAVACGTFNVCGDNSAPAWTDYVEAMLSTMYGVARRGMAAHFLSSGATKPWPGEYGADQDAILTYARRRLSPHSIVRRSVSAGHFALFVHRERPA